MSNAIKYTPAHGRIDVTLAVAGDSFEVRFADTGIGIEAEAIPHLFDRFYRVDSARHREISGTGLDSQSWIRLCRCMMGPLRWIVRLVRVRPSLCGFLVLWKLPRIDKNSMLFMFRSSWLYIMKAE